MGRNVLVAAAWPYVNGSLHLGHVAGLLPADVLARYHRAKGDDVLFVSGSDCHGTPILVTAEHEGKTPAGVAAHYHAEFVEMLIHRLGFSYSLYTQTMGAFHRRTAQELFTAIYEAGHMTPREEEQAFCMTCKRFLPDRYIEGTCPKCGSPGARGDQCDHCGTLANPKDLENPRCRTCGTAPSWQMATHLYFRLPVFQERLHAWVAGARGWRENAITATKGWFAQGLQDRPVTRDLVWGIPVTVPGYTDKCIYVWFEAVMGYLTCSREWAEQERRPDAWRAWWENPDALHYYVHGKDNIPFHTIIWPAMLMALGLHLPDRIVSSEFLNLEGMKLSKSLGVGIWLPIALEKFEPDAIRFYLIFNGPETGDVNFKWDDFRNRVNADLIGNLGNLWNRVFSMAHRYFGYVPGIATLDTESQGLLKKAEQAFATVGGLIEQAELREALRVVLALASEANGYLARREPWKQFERARADAAVTIGVACDVADALRRLAAPFIPNTIAKLNAFLETDDLRWQFDPFHAGRPIGQPSALLSKIEYGAVQDEIAKLRAAKDAANPA